MPNATTTLATTSFVYIVQPHDNVITVASLTGLQTTGASPTQVYLFVDYELMAVEPVSLPGTQIRVRRGVDGTRAGRHSVLSTVYIGRPDQFYTVDPSGVPPTVPYVYPHINVMNGTIWVPQGDESGPGVNGRIWAKVTQSLDAGTFGVRNLTITTPS